MDLELQARCGLKLICCIGLLGSAAHAGGRGSGLVPGSRIKVLEDQRARLDRQLQALPDLEAQWIGERFGFHSDFALAGEDDVPFGRWIELILPDEPLVSAIAFVPAFSPQYGMEKSYGFPRRFKIELFPKDGDDPVHVIDCMQADFPVPGLHPVVFDKIDVRAHRVRIVIDRGEVANGMEYFALGELFVFKQFREGGLSNIAPYSQFTVSDSFSSHPYWASRFLVDRVSALNMPLGKVVSKSETDFIAQYNRAGDKASTIRVRLDLGSLCEIGRVVFFPAKPPSAILLPSFGYPDRMQLEAFRDEACNERVFFKEIRPGVDVLSKRIFERPASDLFFAVPLSAVRGRYIRLTLQKMPVYKDEILFAMGELAVYSQDKNLSEGCPVEITTDLVPLGPLHPERLVDGKVGGRRLLDDFEWLSQLERRAQLERERDDLDSQIENFRNEAEKKREFAVYGTVVLLFFGALATYIRMRLIRSREVRKVKEQVSRDLHDDLGCNIGTIALGIDHLRRHEQDLKLRQELEDLDMIARETSIALEEAIFFTRESTFRLPDLVDRLEDRARIMLADNDFAFTVEGDIPDEEVDFVFKRNTFLFFKEALYNCVKHSQASLVEVETAVTDGHFRLIVSDNGSGFDPDQVRHKGDGLGNMVLRAKNAGGSLVIESAQETGTRLVFDLPLSGKRE